MNDLDNTEVLDERPEPGTTDAQEPNTDATATRDASDKGEPGPVPYHRFREVNQAAQTYSKLGKPEEIEARLAKLADLERRDAEAAETQRQQREADARQANPKLAEAEDLVVDIVRRKFPGVTEDQGRREQERAMQIERHIQHGMDQLPALLKDHGLAATPENVRAYEKLVETTIVNDEALFKGFWKPSQQAEAIKDAFTRVKTSIINPALQATGAKTLDEFRERRTRTLSRASQSGTARIEPKKFTSKHPPGSVGHEVDRAAFRRQAIADALDADSGEESVAL